jgi:hypothetical protein
MDFGVSNIIPFYGMIKEALMSIKPLERDA